VAEVADDESVRAAREEYESARQAQRAYVAGPHGPSVTVPHDPSVVAP
jgi:hypothetical protein